VQVDIITIDAIGNGVDGISVLGASHGCLIDDCLLTSNTGAGIRLDGNGQAGVNYGNTLLAIWAGFNFGTALPNLYGLLIKGSSSNNTIGIANSSNRNVFSGNSSAGIYIIDA